MEFKAQWSTFISFCPFGMERATNIQILEDMELPHPGWPSTNVDGKEIRSRLLNRAFQ